MCCTTNNDSPDKHTQTDASDSAYRYSGAAHRNSCPYTS